MRKIIHATLLLSLILSVSSFTECYKPEGQGNHALPKHIKTIAIPAFSNPSLRYRVEQRFTQAMIDEITHRTRSITVVSSVNGADAVLEGTIYKFFYRPVLINDVGRARMFDITIVAGLKVRDQTKNKVIFDNQSYVFRNEYEISGDPSTYFNEEGPAVDRMAKDFAKSVLTTIMEGF
ncbi:MAG: LptE family protein [Blastocatellia bacterium]|nr:LptE family protein [Blastocatellia bacterium]